MKTILNIFNIRYLFKFLALLASILLFGVTAAFTYKAYIDLLSFIQIKTSSSFIKIYLAYGSALFVAIATLIQSFPVIWDRLNYWGQCMDNAILYFFNNKKYFLDEAEEKQKKIDYIVNEINKELQNYLWSILKDKNFTTNKNHMNKKIQSMVDGDLVKIIKECDHLTKLIKHNETKDNINCERKENLKRHLNDLIIHISDILKYLHEIKVSFQ